MDVGDLAPDFTLSDHLGHDITLSDTLRHGRVVLFFYPAAMSNRCSAESCHFRDLATEFAALGAQRLGISMDSVKRQEKFARTKALDFPLLADLGGRVASLYGVKRGLDVLRVRRTTFVIDTDRTILDIITSELSMAVHADRALLTLAAQG
jgi:peroxiredoxin Q/BCP